VRLSGGEPTIGRPHLLSLLSEVDRVDRVRFILETNGILLGADASYSSDLATFRSLHVRVSLKGSSETEFALLTGARGDGFSLQINALRHLRDAGASCHPAVMSSFSTEGTMRQLRDRISAIDDKLASELEIEELIQYPRVERRLHRFGLTPRVSHDPSDIPERFV